MIYYFNSPEVKEVCKEVTSFPVGRIIRATMKEELEKSKIGKALAYNQIGGNLRIILLPIKDELTFMVNPKITAYSDATNKDREGCLSVPDMFISVERYNTVFVSYRDIHGTYKNISLSDIDARCIQHEIEHLDGITIIDKILLLKRRRKIKQALRKLK